MKPGDSANVKTNNSQLSHDDPRAILIMRATNNKTIHITSFLSEETKKRLRNKRQQYLVQQGENLTMKIRDEHPYAGISTLEYGAANMRLLNYLISNDILPREKIEFYLAYTTLIFELGEKYEWRDVLNFDFQYRERQAEIGFDWGAMVSVMELQLLGGTKNRMFSPQQGQDNYYNKKWNPNNKKTKSDLCRNFANTGECAYGDQCKFKHVRAGPPRASPNPNHSNAGLLPSPPPPQRSHFNNNN